LLCIIIMLFTKVSIYSQNSNCTNLGFELGNFTNWVGHTWVYSSAETQLNTTRQPGIVTRRHTIMSDTSAYDENTGYALKKIPSGYKFSARLGDGFTNADKDFRCWQQSLRYTMTIDSSNALLVLKFALVLQYVSSHSMLEEPRFKLTIYDSKGNVIPDCSNYDVYATNKYVKGFQTYNPPNSTIPIRWRDWTTVGANLLNYIGQTITVEFMATDCTGHFHFGYAYFLAECHPFNITMKYCGADTVAKLTAPIGFEKYSWENKNGVIVDSVQILNILKPKGGETYSCTLTSATGCVVAINSTIAKYIPIANFDSYMIDCKSNTVQFMNLSTTTQGNLRYIWNFGDGKTSAEKNPQYTFATSGLHPMTLILRNPPSICTDTLRKVAESFSPPLVGISGDSTYCPGLGVYQKAYGAFDYTWNNGLKADSIKVESPGGRYWLLGRSSTGCVSDTIYRNITEEPNWEFNSLSDTTLCKGQSTYLQMAGAVKYLWSTKDTTPIITVTSPGKYSVTGKNKRGCSKYQAFNVREYPIPVADFTTSVNTLDSKHNLIICNTNPQTDVNYEWNMGDGTIETGTIVQHPYNIVSTTLQYNIHLKAESIFNCVDSTSKIIDVTPFIPNVFTPNGDGINDLFMPEIDLQICDRNGLVLYHGKSGWDGRYNGRLMDADTYFYLVRYLDRNQKEHLKNGYVMLVR
jgi:gliding motility-associated-like protein